VHTLPDGTQILIRPIAATDKVRLSVALGRLSQRAIRQRFLAAKPRLTSAELSYLTEVDGHDHIAYVAVKGDTLVAVGRVVRVDADTADIAILVWDEWQGLGLGSWLARRLADAAAAEGVTRIAGTMLADNRPALRILKHVSTDFVQDDLSHGVREIVTRLAA
jgi:GNAT superfamily N-acetyltransferase